MRKKRAPRVPSEVLDQAVRAALFVKDEPMDADITREALFAMYHAQCTATDQLAKEAAKRGPKALTSRIAELELALATVNRRLADANMSALATERLAQGLVGARLVLQEQCPDARIIPLIDLLLAEHAGPQSLVPSPAPEAL